MHVNIEPSWKEVLNEEFEKDYFKKLMDFVTEEYKLDACYPPLESIFSAFNYASFKNIKVVIIGQDPYHGPGQSHGLCFSVGKTVAIPPSLRNIFLEIHKDVGAEIPTSGNLERWAKQGVLMLNAIMTVRARQAGSHQNKGWEKFTDAVIQKLSEEREGLVFMLWGGPAKKKGAKVDSEKHLILTSGHPSPLAAIRGHWFGNKHFSKANEYLEQIGKTPINW